MAEISFMALALALLAPAGLSLAGGRSGRRAGLSRLRTSVVLFLGAGLIIGIGPPDLAAAEDEVQRQLAAGETIVSTREIPGSSIKRVEVMGMVEALPEIVWQVITNINAYKFFMPRTLNSLAVAAEKLPIILAKKPSRAEEVEALLGSVPADTGGDRVRGGKYTVYLYSHLDFPFPCNNRWYIIKLLQDESRAGQQRYHSSWSLVTGNLRENSGEWLLEPFASGQTKVTYRLLTDPGGAIPGFMVDRGTCQILPQIIAAVRKRVAGLNRRP